MSLYHEGKSADELTVSLDGRGKLHTDVSTPGEDDVQVTVGDGELATNQEVGALEQVLLDVLELGGNLLELGSLGIALEAVEQRSVRSVHLRGQVVQGVLSQVSFRSAIFTSDLTRSLFAIYDISDEQQKLSRCE